MTTEFMVLARRLERVERENRRLKVAGLVALALVGALFCLGVAVNEPVIGAEAFTLMNDKGELRAVFAMVNNEPTLAFFDAAGKVRAGLSMVENAPRFILYAADGNPIWSAP